MIIRHHSSGLSLSNVKYQLDRFRYGSPRCSLYQAVTLAGLLVDLTDHFFVAELLEALPRNGAAHEWW